MAMVQIFETYFGLVLDYPTCSYIHYYLQVRLDFRIGTTLIEGWLGLLLGTTAVRISPCHYNTNPLSTTIA